MSKNADLAMTYPSLRFMDPIDPDPKDFDIADIANSLGNKCRFNGHVPRFYSVAEHCVLMANFAWETERSRVLAFALLMDDAPESYIGDMMRPLKKRMPEFRALDAKYGDRIAQAFGTERGYPIVDEYVKAIDFRMLRTEMDEMFDPEIISENFPHIHAVDVLPGVKLKYWSPDYAGVMFMDAFLSLSGGQ